MTRRGRPRSFSKQVALEAAMLLFWKRGFEQTGVDDLVWAMGVSTSSLYSTFEDKEALFLAALDLYQSGRGRYTTTALTSGKSAQESFRNLLDIAAFELTRPGQPRGCMLALSMTTSSPGHEKLQKELKRRRALSAQEFLSRLKEAVLQKELPTSTDLDALASFLMTTLMGMSLQARSGATRQSLLKIADMALHAWPSAPKKADQKTFGKNRRGMQPAKTLR